MICEVLDNLYFLGVNTDMIRVKFIKNYKQYNKGDVESLSPNEAFGVIDAGFAMVSKDMTESDYTVAQIPSVFVIDPKKTKTKEK